MWSPEKLNGDPDWRAERGINSLEMLSFLKLAYHMSGDEKYETAYRSLLFDHGYAENVRQAKAYQLMWRTHIDDELLILVYPVLLLHEKDPDLLALYRESLDHWFLGVRDDESPFLSFHYAGLTGQDVDLDSSVRWLRDTPLDLICWTLDNTKREDIALVRAPEIEPLQTARMLPASERGVVRVDKNPWQAVDGDGGRSEWAPTSWLASYWMGRYFGCIDAP